MTPTARLVLVLLLVLLPLAGCGSGDPWKLPYDKLELAMVHLDGGFEQDAVSELEDLLALTEAQADTYGLQRFYASYLLARAHARALRNERAFLYEEVPVDASLAALVETSGRRPSANAHLMAALLHASDASKAVAAVRDAPRDATLDDGTSRPLLPPALMDFPVLDVNAFLFLVQLAALGELGFEDDVRADIERVPGLETVAGCEQLIERARIDAEGRDYLFVFLYRAQRPLDRELAFRFAVRALMESTNNDGTFDLDETALDEINAFMESGFVCTSCGTSVSGGFLYCPEDGSAYIESVKDAAPSSNGNGNGNGGG